MHVLTILSVISALFVYAAASPLNATLVPPTTGWLPHNWALGTCHVDINIRQVCAHDGRHKFVRTFANFHITDALNNPISGLSGDGVPDEIDVSKVDVGVIKGQDGFKFKWKWYEGSKTGCRHCDVWDKMTYIFEPSGKYLDDEGVSCTEKVWDRYQGHSGWWYEDCKQDRKRTNNCNFDCAMLDYDLQHS